MTRRIDPPLLIRSSLALALAACGGARPGAHGTPTATPSPVAQVQVVRADDRPSLTLVDRQGDPTAGVALAIAHGGGSALSVAIASLVTHRVQAAGFADARSSVDGLGFEIAASAASPEKAGEFVAASARALSTPVEARDPVLGRIERDLARLTALPALGRAARATAECSGELAPVRKADSPDPRSTAGLATVQRWQSQAYSARGASYAAVGPRAVLDAVSRAVTSMEAWPAGDADSLDAAWPNSDVAGATPSHGPARRLSIALRLGDLARVAATASELSSGNALLERAGLIAPGSSVERVWFTARPRGACLRADVRLGDQPGAVPTSRIAALAVALRDEMDYGLAHSAPSRWSLEQAIVGTADPRDSASVAAWLALGDRLASGPTVQAVTAHVSALEVESADNTLGASIDALRAAHPSTIERVVRVESGQGELWALLASPCGTRGEGADDAGVSALAVYALAAHTPRVDGIEIEPWVTEDGVGLLAHGPPHDATEGANDLAERIGRALAHAFAGRPSSTETASVRASLLERLEQRGGAGWWTTLESLAPGHPSWLQAAGTWASVSEVPVATVDARQRVLFDRPLRLAVLANASDAQSSEIQRVIEQWLAPVRGTVRPCLERPGAMPRSGQFNVETSDGTRATGAAQATTAYVAVPIAPLDSGLPPEAEVATALLNGTGGKGGWLDRALVTPGLAASARAVTLGGRRAAALVIEVRAMDTKLDRAVSQLRALLSRLAQGALTDADARAALERWTREHDAKQVDPRYRVVRLWSGTNRPMPTAATIQRFLHSLGPQSHVVVTVKSRP